MYLLNNKKKKINKYYRFTNNNYIEDIHSIFVDKKEYYEIEILFKNNSDFIEHKNNIIFKGRLLFEDNEILLYFKKMINYVIYDKDEISLEEVKLGYIKKMKIHFHLNKNINNLYE